MVLKSHNAVGLMDGIKSKGCQKQVHANPKFALFKFEISSVDLQLLHNNNK